jgi:hypothetical protein
VQKTLKEIDFLVSGGPNAQAARKKVQENLEAFAYKPVS